MTDQHHGNGHSSDGASSGKASFGSANIDDPPLSAVVVAAINELGACVEDLGGILPHLQGANLDAIAAAENEALPEETTEAVAERLEVCAKALRKAKEREGK